MHIWRKMRNVQWWFLQLSQVIKRIVFSSPRKMQKFIGWQNSDLKWISPLVCTHHIYMEEDAKPVRQPEEVESSHVRDSLWVSPTQVVPKKSGITVIQNEKGEEVSTRLTSGWRASFLLFFGWLLGYFQIEIDLEDQEKTTFTCPFGTFAYRRMPFGLCNALATFQRCMLSIFSDMVERIIKECLWHIEAVLQRCIKKDLVLNWEKCHFMVQQGIVLGHIISKNGIEVDKAKVELIVHCHLPQMLKELEISKSFEELKQFLTIAPIVRAPNWKLPFEVMCDASDLAMGAVLGQREDGKPYVIYYASKTLNEAQRNYTTREGVVGDELVIAHDSHGLPINDDFPEESLMSIEVAPWYSHIANYLVTGEVPSEWSAQDKKHFFAKIHAYYWEEPFLFKYCADQIIRKCVPEQEQSGILSHCHDSACGGHFASQKTAMKVVQSGFWWPSLFKDAHAMCKGCDHVKGLGMDVFDVWGIDFMGPFPMSFGHSYILVGVDYVSKWVEAIPCRSNDHKVVLKFLKENIFSRFGVPKAIISDGGTHFCYTLSPSNKWPS
ncbi:hypothetical protein AAG906_028226 [Vitis piasezkii]